MPEQFFHLVEDTVLNIGFDDTDSPKGMCTTYLAYKIVDSLKKEKVEFIDYPKLIRFNPNIPWKTRGNGAVSLKIRTSSPEKIKKKVIRFVTKFSDLKNGANPGVVFFESKAVPDQFTKFSRDALWQLVSRSRAKKFLAENNVDSFHIGNGQGLIGAIGAIGYKFDDHTYELLSYRKRSKFGTKRNIVASSVKQMQESLPKTFNSYDTKKQKVLLAPRGPDPVFFGVRGENVDSVLSASKMIKSDEKPVGHMVFKSNQGTGDHLLNQLDVLSLKPYSSGVITGTVLDEPEMKLGGYVMFSILKQGVKVNCAVYKPTGITQNALNLIKGDVIRVGGGLRKASKNHTRTLNVEFFQVLKLQERKVPANPLCTRCNKRMKSKGRSQGFECVKCGRKKTKKVTMTIPRNLQKRLYIPQSSAHRHLTRPQQRIGITNKESKFDKKIPWFSVY
ncbi:tRNA(Ile)(2)-agmatinylcytidine synthase [Candidatus Nitrosotenuis cloacae]|uniref:tRNA(Ile)(2)-agmatinylcytidine synthase n=1 Tax=Candidatus Nitrosotenuis cloacae TaxID=1603555 RepID=UPI002281198E|nr:tRNA(Ile)(2)-agmatinylcytidine synthase [Candidatus Nitrosotenuis cloacae]